MRRFEMTARASRMYLVPFFFATVALASGQAFESCAAAECAGVPPKYQAVSGVRIRACQEAGDQTCNISQINALNAGHCWKLCESLTDVCRLFTYNADLKHCIIYDQDFYSSWTTTNTAGASWTTYYKRDPSRWKLLFKISQGIGVNPTNAFLEGPSTGYATKDMMKPDDSCKCYIRNDIVTNWAKFPITTVSVDLAKGGTNVKGVLFSAVGQTPSTFFQQKNIIRSSWTDLTATSTVWLMTMPALTSPTTGGRQFLIVKNNWNGCNTDIGWMSVFSEGSPNCPEYDKVPVPSMAYTPGPTADIFQGKATFADALLIYAKM